MMESSILDRFVLKKERRPRKVATKSSQIEPTTSGIDQPRWTSTTNLPVVLSSLSGHDTNVQSTDGHNEVVATRDFVADQLSEIISSIDEESYPTADQSIVIWLPESPSVTSSRELVVRDVQDAPRARSFWPTRGPQPPQPSQHTDSRSINILAKLSYYSNTSLPPSLPPFRAYISTYPLLCLAALCSANAYHPHQNAVTDEQLISADTRIGTKAMVIKAATCAQKKVVTIAIRGTSVLSLRDWNTNLNTAPQSPAGFLDDDGNYCHSGFLRVARAMVKPIAGHLRHLLEENPTRLSYSLLLTGHSAGGAVASLLYAHMLSEQAKSELTILAECFKRVHCVTFGAPPVSLLPLQKPAGKQHRLQASLFHSFINEGDPVTRAEKGYVRSLVDLLTSPPPTSSPMKSTTGTNPVTQLEAKDLSGSLALVPTSTKLSKSESNTQVTQQKANSKSVVRVPPLPPRSVVKATWKVPQHTLSNAGRLVVLRGPEPQPKAVTSQADLTREFEEVRAFTTTDEQLRSVMFGDPLMHGMDVYRRRIEALAMKAVTGRDEFY